MRYICGDVAIHITGTWTDEYSVAPRHRRTRCSGLRNCNVNPDDLRPDRPDLDCEPQQARGIPRNVQMDETKVVRVVVVVVVNNLAGDEPG